MLPSGGQPGSTQGGSTSQPPTNPTPAPIVKGGMGVSGEHSVVLTACENCGWNQTDQACQQRVRPMPLLGARRDRCILESAAYARCMGMAFGDCTKDIPASCRSALATLNACK